MHSMSIALYPKTISSSLTPMPLHRGGLTYRCPVAYRRPSCVEASLGPVSYAVAA
jgi:hypothetical protein